MEKYGCHIYTFDPTMHIYNICFKRSKNGYFYATGLYHEDIEKDSHGWKMWTLSSIFENLKSHHGDVVIDHLKIDIERAEWKVSF